MNSLEMYSLRVFDRLLPGRNEDKYCDLNNIRGKNIIDILNSALSLNSGFLDLREFTQAVDPNKDINDVPKKLFNIDRLSVTKHTISGVLQVGEYGSKNDIINRIKKHQVGEIGVDDSVLHNHFFYIETKPNQRRALFFIQAINGRGVKTIFELLTLNQFKRKTGGLVCQIRPLIHQNLVQQWNENAEVCEIRLSNFTKPIIEKDITDKLTDSYAELIIRPRKRNSRLGRLCEMKKGYIEILNEQATNVKVQVEFDGRKRLFNLSSDNAPLSSVELEESDKSLVFELGSPTLESITNYSMALAKEAWEMP